MSSHWTLLSALVIPIGIFLARNGFSTYRSFQSSREHRRSGIKPLGRKTAYALNILFVAAVAALLSTHPHFSPPNVFVETNARFQTTVDVIFNRLAALRDLTPLDQLLKQKLTTQDGRLLYFVYGPHILTGCTICSYDEPSSYLLYSLPSTLGPHLFHLVVLGVATSKMIGGPDSARWRTLTIMAAATLALMELWETYGYERTLNSRATRPTDIDFFYWRMQTRRGLQFAAFDALLGWLMWLSATNRFFVQPPSTLDKLGQACRSLEQGQICLSVAGDVRGAVAQNDGLRTKLAGFWDEERDVYQEQDVVNGTRAALSRADIQSLTTAAERRSHHIMGNALNQPGSPVKSL